MDLGWDGSGQGGMDGLMKGQMMVEWEMDSADRTCDDTAA